MQGLVQLAQSPRHHGEAQTPMSNQSPCGAQGRRLLGPAALCARPFASLLGQARARLGLRGYCRHSGNGDPQTCLPAACGVAQRGPSMAHLHQHKLKTLARGQASRGGRQGASSGTALSGWLTRRRREQGGVPHEVPVTQAMMTRARQAPAYAVSLFPLWCKGGKRRRGVPRHQAKVSILVQRDQDQKDGKTEIIVEPKTASPPEPFAGEDRFCQDKLY